MTNDQNSQPDTQAKQYKTLLVIRFAKILNQPRLLIEECGLGFLERNAMLFLVEAALLGVPFKVQFFHTDSVITT